MVQLLSHSSKLGLKGQYRQLHSLPSIGITTDTVVGEVWRFNTDFVQNNDDFLPPGARETAVRMNLRLG